MVALAVLAIICLSSMVPCADSVVSNITGITEWEFEADPLDVGVAEQWYSVQARSVVKTCPERR